MGKKTANPLANVNFLDVAQTEMPPLARKRKSTTAATEAGPSKKLTLPKKTPPGPPSTQRVEQASLAATERGKKVAEQTSTATGMLPRGLVWTAGLVSEFENGLLPPRRYYEPSELAPEEVRELADLETASLKVASMIHAYVSLNRKYSKTHKELSASNARAEEKTKKAEEEKKRAAEEKKRAEEEKKRADAALQAAEEARKLADEANKRAEDAKNSEREALSQLEDEKKRRQETEEESDALAAEAQTRVELLKAALNSSIDGSFENAIQQIRYFYPKLSIDVALLNSRARIVDGKLIPPPGPPASPEGVSVQRLTQEPGSEAGEETSALQQQLRTGSFL